MTVADLAPATDMTSSPSPGGARPRRRFRTEIPLLLSPAFAILALFVIIPLGVVATLTLFNYDPLSGASHFVGLSNFRRILGSSEYRGAALNTAEYFLLTVPMTLILGLLAALAVHSLHWGGAFWRATYFLPVASTLAAMSVVWRWMFYPDTGLFDATIGRLTGTHGWLTNDHLVVPAISLVGVWEGVGFATVIFLAGLSGVSTRLHEAAQLDGAGAWTRFWHVTWPGIGAATVFNLVIASRNALRVYDEVYVMTQGGPANASNTLAYLIWKRGIQFLDVGGGAVITISLLAIVLLVTAVEFLLIGRRLERGAAQ